MFDFADYETGDLRVLLRHIVVRVFTLLATRSDNCVNELALVSSTLLDSCPSSCVTRKERTRCQSVVRMRTLHSRVSVWYCAPMHCCNCDYRR